MSWIVFDMENSIHVRHEQEYMKVVEVDDQGGGENQEKAIMLGPYITKEYELLKLVLRCLSLRDLHVASQVCRTWKSAVDVLQRLHVRVHYLLWHIDDKTPMEEVPNEMFSKYFYSEPQLCLIFMTSYVNMAEINCRETKMPCPCGQGERCTMSHRVLHYLRAELAPNCPCVMIEGHGIVGSSHDLMRTLEVEEGSEGYSALFIPSLPGLTVTIFHLSQEECRRISKAKRLSAEDIENVTRVPPASEPIRCLLLFVRERMSGVVNAIVRSLENRQGGQFAVGGALFEGLNLGGLCSSHQKRRVSLMGIAFSGDAVHAASTILGSKVKSQEHVHEAMDKMRLNLPQSQESLAFMFACVGRGHHWYKEYNVESTSFRQHFPSTPLVGYFGAGEIGQNYFPVTAAKQHNGLSPECAAQRKRPSPAERTLLHSYTSVFVCLTLDKQPAV